MKHTNMMILAVTCALTLVTPDMASEEPGYTLKKPAKLTISLKSLKTNQAGSPPASPRTRVKNHNAKEQKRYEDDLSKYEAQTEAREYGSMGGMFTPPHTPREPELWPTPGTSPAATPREFSITSGAQSPLASGGYDSDGDIHHFAPKTLSSGQNDSGHQLSPLEQLAPADMVKLIKWETETPVADAMMFYQGPLSETKILSMITIISNSDEEITPLSIAEKIVSQRIWTTKHESKD